MSSPVLPSQFCELVAPSTASLCYRFKTLLLTLPQLLCDSWSYMFDADGMPTTAFVEDLAESGAFFAAGDMKYTLNQGDQVGWIECNGTDVSRETYPDLHIALRDMAGANSYYFGSGNGSSTFTLPDLRGRCIIGSTDSRPTALPSGVSLRNLGTTTGVEDVTLTEAQIPAHTHTTGEYTHALKAPFVGSVTGGDTVNSGTEAAVDDSEAMVSFGGGESHTNMQPSFTARCMIYVGRTVA